MPLQLEALPALYGDALLLHYGTKAKPGLIIVDGGPKTVYANSLRLRLDDIKKKRSPNDPLPVRLVMVSHIDEDHIMGILDLANELAEAKGEKLVAVDELWHNAFTDIVGDADDKYLKTAGGAAVASAAGTTGGGIIASVGQGKQLRSLANKLGWVVNNERPLMMAGTGDDTIPVGELKLTILGPSHERLVKLQKEFAKHVKAAEAKKATVVEYDDNSPANLGSIIVFVTDGKKKILLTGDGRGDYILEGIENAKLMKKGKFAVDVLKVPHHGSIRDLDRDFFENIPATDYVISANGKFDNPDIATLEMLLDVRGNEAYNVHLTYPVDAFEAKYDRKTLQKMIDGSKKKKYKIIPRDAAAKSVVV